MTNTDFLKPDVPPAELAWCPECQRAVEWPDPWEVGGMSIDVDEEGAIADTEDGDDGRVICPNCGEIVMPVIYDQTTALDPDAPKR